MHFNDIINEAHQTATKNGFWDDRRDNPIGIATALMLINSELVEAMNVDRVTDVAKLEVGHPDLEKFGEELADVVIRLADLAGYLNLDMDYIITTKLEINRSRPRKHGKRY